MIKLTEKYFFFCVEKQVQQMYCKAAVRSCAYSIAVRGDFLGYPQACKDTYLATMAEQKRSK